MKRIAANKFLIKIKYLVLLLILFCAMPVRACEPIVPLAALYAGEFSLAVMAHSFPFLIIVVGIKCLMFAWLVRGFLRWYTAIFLMLIANVASTLVGIAAAIPFSVPIFTIAFIPVVFGIAFFPARRYSEWFSEQLKTPVKPSAVAGLATVMFAGSIILFILATGLLDAPEPSLGWYWFIKIGYVYLALLLSIGLTIYIEEGVISLIVKDEEEEEKAALRFAAVARANLVTMLLITFVGAIKVLPARLASPDFLL